MEVSYEGYGYRWNGKVWLDEDYLQVPDIVAGKLCDRFLSQFIDLSSPDWVRNLAHLRQAGVDRDSRATLNLVEKACLRRLTLRSTDVVAATILSSCLRQLGQARRALAVTEPFAQGHQPVLLTTRAAALCDLGLWHEAEATIQRALALGGGCHAHQVRFRIEAQSATLSKKQCRAAGHC